MSRRLLALTITWLAVVALVACAADPTGSAVPSVEHTQAPVGTVAALPTSAATAQPMPTPAAATDTPASPQLMAGALLRLTDFLDDPQGYCVDVAGFGDNIRLESPLQAHTCKPGSHDQLFVAVPDGVMKLVEYDRCLTAFNLALDAPVHVAPCDSGLSGQAFTVNEHGWVYLPVAGSNPLCLGVAAGSGEPAGGRNHLRRDLALYDCEITDRTLVTWEHLNP